MANAISHGQVSEASGNMGPGWGPSALQEAGGRRAGGFPLGRDQEGRWGSDEVVPGPSVFHSREPGVSGNSRGSIKGAKYRFPLQDGTRDFCLEYICSHTPLLHCKLPEGEVHMLITFFYPTAAGSEGLGVLNEWPLK